MKVPSVRLAMKRTRVYGRNTLEELIELSNLRGWNLNGSEESEASCPEEEECRLQVSLIISRYRWEWCVDWLKDVSLKRFLNGNSHLYIRRNDIIKVIDHLSKLHTQFDRSLLRVLTLNDLNDGHSEGSNSLNSSLNESLTDDFSHTTCYEDMCNGNTQFEVSGAGTTFVNGTYLPSNEYWDSVSSVLFYIARKIFSC